MRERKFATLRSQSFHATNGDSDTESESSEHGAMILTAQRRTRRNPKRAELPDASGADQFLRSLTESATRVMACRYAPSTWRRKQYLLHTFQQFCRHHRLRSDDQAAILCLQWVGTGTSKRTLLGYARTLRATTRQFRTDLFDEYVAGLHALAVKEPLHQAGTFSKPTVQQILDFLPEAERWMTWLAWMTASRWADIVALSKPRLLSSPQSLIIDFQGVTKSSLKKPHRIDHLVAIPWHVPRARQFWNWVQNRVVPFPTISTAKITTLLRRITQRTDVTAHSIKRSALAVLMLAAHQKLIPMRLVAQMGKHLGLDPLLPDVTVGYIGNRTLLAEANGSSTATALLDVDNAFGRDTSTVNHLIE